MVGRTLHGRNVVTGEAVKLTIGQGVITAIEPGDASDDALLWIGPGLVDLQVNGYAGIDLNADDLTPERVSELARVLLRVGVTSWLPTIITAAPDAIDRRLQAVATAVRLDPLVADLVAGIHLEGPFISPEDGSRGAHPLAAVRPPDRELFRQWYDGADGAIRIVTLSPEWPEATDFIRFCCEIGVIPAIGHTAATPEQIRVAVAAGARLSTHLGNGAQAMLPRHPNYLWEQLATDELWASFIADGFHLPDAVMKTIMRMKPARAFLVSDSVALAGMPPGDYHSAIGSRVVLTPDGRLHLAADPRLLAGSAQPLLAGITHLVRSGLATLSDAWSMASVIPHLFLHPFDQTEIAVGAPADLVVFQMDADKTLSIRYTLKKGEVVFDSAEEQDE